MDHINIEKFEWILSSLNRFKFRTFEDSLESAICWPLLGIHSISENNKKIPWGAALIAWKEIKKIVKSLAEVNETLLKHLVDLG